MRDQDQTTFSARDLLYLYLEMRQLTPKEKEWNEKALAENPPRLIRLQRLKALFRAFSIPFDLKKFRKGRFIDWKNPVYEVFLERARAAFSKQVAEGKLSGMLEVDSFYLSDIFSHLLKYRWELERALSFNAGLLCAGNLFYFEFITINAMDREIRSQLPMIDDLLVELISPTYAAVSRGELVNKYSYPDVDLGEIDLDWV
jgi:hypothetical protein